MFGDAVGETTGLDEMCVGLGVGLGVVNNCVEVGRTLGAGVKDDVLGDVVGLNGRGTAACTVGKGDGAMLGSTEDDRVSTDDGAGVGGLLAVGDVVGADVQSASLSKVAKSVLDSVNVPAGKWWQAPLLALKLNSWQAACTEHSDAHCSSVTPASFSIRDPNATSA